MHPRTSELFDHLDRSRATLDSAIESVPRDLRSTKPAEDRWSVAQIVEHLAVTEGRIAGMIAKVIGEAREKGIADEVNRSPILPSIDSTKRVLDRTTKIKTGLEPTGTVDLGDGLRALDAARVELKAAAMQGDGLDISTVFSAHRVFGSLNMYAWIAFVGSHMARHAEQVRELRDEL